MPGRPETSTVNWFRAEFHEFESTRKPRLVFRPAAPGRRHGTSNEKSGRFSADIPKRQSVPIRCRTAPRASRRPAGIPRCARCGRVPSLARLLGNCARNQEGEAGAKKKEEPPRAAPGGSGTTVEWKRFSTIHPPRAVAGQVQVHGIEKQNRILARAKTHGFFPSADTAAPDPSFRVWIASTGRSAKRSTSPLGQRISTRSTLVAAPSPKCTLISLLEM